MTNRVCVDILLVVYIIVLYYGILIGLLINNYKFCIVLLNSWCFRYTIYDATCVFCSGLCH